MDIVVARRTTAEKIGRIVLFFFKIILVNPLMALAGLPRFLYKQVGLQFIMNHDHASNPVINYSDEINTSGLFYWLRNAAGIKRSGVLGFDFRTYMGAPTGLFDFPLSGLLLSRIGYKNLFLLSLGILLVVFSILFSGNGYGIFINILLVIILLCSNIVWEQLSHGLYEIFAWSVALCAYTFLGKGFIVVAGLVAGVAALCHPTVFMICFMACEAYLVLTGAGTETNLVFAFATIPGCFFWIVPFIANRRRLCRSMFLKFENDDHQQLFSFSALIQILIFSFFVASFWLVKMSPLSLILLLPVAFALLNFKVWIFSPYTLRMAMLFTAVLVLAADFHIVPFVCLLPFLFIKPAYLSDFYRNNQFLIKIKPFRSARLHEAVNRMFTRLGINDTVAIEYIPKNWKGIYFVSFLSFILRDSNTRVFNVGFSEIYNKYLFSNITKNLNTRYFSDEVNEKLRRYGIRYLAVFTEEFKLKLLASGYELTDELDLSDYGLFEGYNNDTYVPRKIFLLRYNSLQEASLMVENVTGHSMRIKLLQPGDHVLPVQYFPGLTVFRDHRKLPHEVDAVNFIELKNCDSGVVELRYSRIRMWRTALADIFSGTFLKAS